LNVKKVCIRNSKEKKEIEVRLDTKMTDELEIEGYAREVSRAVQAERKKQGLVKTDSITLLVLTKPEFVSKISLQKKFIADRTGSKKIDISEISDEKKGKLKNILSVKVKDIDFEIYFEKTK